MAEIGREFASILNLDELLTRIANLTRRVIDYRTFGILLINEETNELEMKVAVRYGEQATVPRIKVGHGLTGYAALHKQAVLVPDVSKDPALHPAGRRCEVGAGDSAAAEGSLHRRLRSREPGARRLQEE